jgi:hypothetical protein
VWKAGLVGLPEGTVVTGSDHGIDLAELMARRFDLGCLVALLSCDLRPRALAELTDVDPDFFFLGHDHPRVVTESALADGTPPVKQALAQRVHDEGAQLRLLALGDLGVDTALADNPCLTRQVDFELRRRRPELVASAAAYRPYHHRAALVSDDPELAAAALLDRREARYHSPFPPTVWATAWRTVRLRYGAGRVCQLIAALPAGRSLDAATVEIAEACAEPDPEPFLSSAEDRLTGTGALLSRLRQVRTFQDLRSGHDILDEPYRIDWALVTAAALGQRLPRTAARMLAQHPDCPAPVARTLRTGRPAPPEPDRVAEAPASAAPPAEGSARPSARAARPYYRAPMDPGPLVKGDPATVLSTTAIGADLTIHHVWSAIEMGLIDAASAVQRARPAMTVACHAGQESAFHAHTQEPDGGREALHDAAVDYLARRLTAAPPVPGLWTEVSALIRSFEGTLPELLDTAACRAASVTTDRQ